MSRFEYQARDATGRMDCGVVTADSAEEAARLLRRDGKAILSVREEQTELTEYGRARARKARIKRDEIIFFTTQLAVMVDTGVPLSEALDSISAQTEHPGMKVVVEDISEDIKGGVEFSAALQKYKRKCKRVGDYSRVPKHHASHSPGIFRAHIHLSRH